jgi:hypothetical protein
MKDEDPIEYEEGYDPYNEVHNPALYVWSRQEVMRKVENARVTAMKARLKDKPGEFAKLGCVYWILIIALCFFVGYLLALYH